MQRVFYGISLLCFLGAAFFALRGAGVSSTPSYERTLATGAEIASNFSLASGLVLGAALWAGIGKIIELLQIIANRLAPVANSHR